MRPQILAGALALAGTSAAFSDSTPWVLLSTSAFPGAPDTHQIQASLEAVEFTKNAISSCPTDRYLIASQPGAHAADLRGPNGCAMPRLCQAVEDTRIQGRYVVSEVVGDVSVSELTGYIRSACSAHGKEASIDELNLAPLMSSQSSSLTNNDIHLGEHLKTLMTGDSFTVLYVGTQGELTYEAEFSEPVRMDLKRNVDSNIVRQEGNDTEFNRLPLFEKYQFFTPGIFMGIIVAIVLLSILGVGLKALASLEVSYGAFDKDMGPAAQKKQQ